MKELPRIYLRNVETGELLAPFTQPTYEWLNADEAVNDLKVLWPEIKEAGLYEVVFTKLACKRPMHFNAREIPTLAAEDLHYNCPIESFGDTYEQ